MIQEACAAIDTVLEEDRRLAADKYRRRNTMRYIDSLLGELELLNLADQAEVPPPLATAINEVIASNGAFVLGKQPWATVVAAMDQLFELQDSLMYNQIEEE